MDRTTRFLGIDPGLRTTGYGAIACNGRRARLIEAGIVEPHAAQSLEERLRELHRGMCEVIASLHPDAVVIEELYTTYRNPLTAIMMGHARGVLCLAAAQHDVPVRTVAHSQVKRALIGSGAATKDQVGRAVVEMLRLREAPRPNDVSDALALALTFWNVLDHERRFSFPLRAAR